MLAVAFGFYEAQPATSSKKDQVILNMVYNVLNTNHFAPAKINDDFSEKVYQSFLKNLDFNKRIFTQEDIAKLARYETLLDDEIKNTNLSFFEEAYALYEQRFTSTKEYFESVLAQPFNFNLDEELERDDEKLSFAQNEDVLRERWRKYLKSRVMMRIEDKLEDQENAEAKKDTAVKIKSFETLEAEAREKELELHNDWYTSLKDLDRIDWIGFYVNAITNVYDPHTQYFPPERKEDFEIGMSGQLQGIGAQLSQKGDYITVAEIITGSPCWKQGDLEVGDKIVKVQQGDEEDDEAIDLIGMSVRKAVKFIRGPKGSEVILTVQKVNGTKQIIPIVRDIIELEATFAKSAVLGEGDNKVGYIKLPKFYVNFNDKDGRDCATDVQKELEKLKEENVSGVILDLRNNGGGSLQGVIDMVGLFINKGPVVQVVTPGRSPQVLSDRNSGTTYDGPLVVMVNQFSASASEIFAAAIQDYKRGLIIGSKSTFGKGTVQNVFDMDRNLRFVQNDLKPLGALKLTIQKYYRINGGTPQLRGVQSDIILPDNYTYLDFGEKEQDYALPYDEIDAAEYEIFNDNKDAFSKAISNSQKSVASNDKFDLIDEYAQWLKEERENTTVSLNFDKYRAEQEELRERNKRFKNIRKSDMELSLQNPKSDLAEIEADEEKIKKNNDWFKGLRNDLYLVEAVKVVDDLNG
jgi:carboxyl-terminal processing protease